MLNNQVETCIEGTHKTMKRFFISIYSTDKWICVLDIGYIIFDNCFSSATIFPLLMLLFG